MADLVVSKVEQVSCRTARSG